MRGTIATVVVAVWVGVAGCGVDSNLDGPVANTAAADDGDRRPNPQPPAGTYNNVRERPTAGTVLKLSLRNGEFDAVIFFAGTPKGVEEHGTYKYSVKAPTEDEIEKARAAKKAPPGVLHILTLTNSHGFKLRYFYTYRSGFLTLQNAVDSPEEPSVLSTLKLQQ
jgi:hypothetical protein